MPRTWTNRRATPSYCLCLLSPGQGLSPVGNVNRPQTPNHKHRWRSGFWESTLNPCWCRGQDKWFSQGQDLGQTTENTCTDVVATLGLPGSIFLSYLPALPASGFLRVYTYISLVSSLCVDLSWILCFQKEHRLWERTLLKDRQGWSWSKTLVTSPQSPPRNRK